MQNQTAPVAFTTARVPNGPLQKVFEQDGYRWTEGGNGTRHFWRSDCDIVPGRVAVHFVLVAMVQERFRKVGEAIGVELKSPEE